MKGKEAATRGNTVAEHQQLVDEAFARWTFDLQVNELLEALYEGGEYVKSFRLVSPKNPGGNWLCVIAAERDGNPQVGFVSGADCIQALRDAITQIRTGKVKWQDDRYAK